MVKEISELEKWISDMMIFMRNEKKRYGSCSQGLCKSGKSKGNRKLPKFEIKLKMKLISLKIGQHSGLKLDVPG